MRVLTLIVAASLLTGVLMHASAQTVVDDDPARLVAPDTPQATEAIPDWYQRFSSPDGAESSAPWTGYSKTDVQVDLLRGRRWNLQLALTSREGDIGLPREEMWAGASFNITSRLSIGGAVGVGTDDLGPGANWGTQEVETGIRLQSAFKF